MARKARDYKAEEARRNEIARALGYKNRAQMRRAVELGFIAPKRPEAIRSPRTIAAQKWRAAMAARDYDYDPRTPIDREPTEFERIVAGIKPERMARDWSAAHAKTPAAEFDFEGNEDVNVAKRDFIKAHGMTAYIDAYLNAFVLGGDRYVNRRHAGGSPAMLFWFVVVTMYMTVPEYDGKYRLAS